MNKLLIIIALILLVPFTAAPQFSAVTVLSPLAINTDTKEKPQSKVWFHDGRFWTVLSHRDGMHVFRLDGATWTKVLKIADSDNARADCKVLNETVHILLFRRSTSYLVSLEYIPAEKNYKPWPARTANVPLKLHPSAKTATLDIDSKNRMWLASDADSTINMYWSDFPYAQWSEPVTVASGISADDIGAVIALPMFSRIGVFWSDQNSKRFGFKTHADGAAPEQWSSDEVPASQSAIDFGGGMADDHMNMALSNDGTLYCAVKTSYDKLGFPRLALLIRRPAGSWEPLHEISQAGTRPVAVLNDAYGKLRIVYSAKENGSNILYKETATDRIAFGPEQILISGNFNHSTSLKNNPGTKTVILASDSIHAVGVLAEDFIKPQLRASPNPFYSHTTVDFIMPVSGEYTVNIYSLLGRRVRTLRKSYARAGEKQYADLDASDLANGIYFLRLETEERSQTLKLIRN